ncbi:Murein hydrolase activator NlpD precursor [Corynebacterium ciconiae DSM 44920]|uniref:M23 family metallopeptidase n=1 Tax=Corynebacterium ciconiae TaxID=227319 RepID=UPI00037EA35E|nr:M23 family metallopeptidase [Corynebacterium ciconiae]WKD61671.1 Murein hydrolase activator NlpD precursor [Corynebacterium ciconiae DSM 44920]
MQTQTRAHAKHRSTAMSATAKGRVAAVAFATGAVSVAGAGGAAVAATTADSQPESANFELAADPATALPDAQPQILAIAEYKPVEDLSNQVQTALKFTKDRLAADAAARAPKAAKPAEGAFTSPFGPRWGTMHNGIDIANAVGTSIVSVLDGTVIDAGPASGFGNWVRVLHDDGTITVYGHMETVEVAVGQKVTAGQRIAGMGSRGFSTGSHLHFEVHPGGGGPIDPVPWLSNLGINV